MITIGHKKNTRRTDKIRLTINFDKSVIDEIRRISFTYSTSMSSIVNDICKQKLQIK